MAKYFAILSLLFTWSCTNSDTKNANKTINRNPYDTSDYLEFRYGLIRENGKKSKQEIYRCLLVWSWGKNPYGYGGGVMIISIGKEDTTYYVRLKEFKESNDENIMQYGDCKDISRRIDSLKFIKFQNDINKIDTSKNVRAEYINSDPTEFSFEGVLGDSTIINGSTNDKYSIELAIKFLEIVNYDKRGIQRLESELEKLESSIRRVEVEIENSKKTTKY